MTLKILLGMFGHGLKIFPLLMTPTSAKIIHSPRLFLLKDEMSQIILLALLCQKMPIYGKSVQRNVDQKTIWTGSTVKDWKIQLKYIFMLFQREIYDAKYSVYYLGRVLLTGCLTLNITFLTIC